MSTGMEIQLADVRKHEAVLIGQQEKLEKWCSGGEVRGEALIRHALAEMSTNDDLRQCTPTSVYLSLLACAVTGLVPGKLRGYSFLVPFGNTKRDGDKEYKVQEATFMMGWKGVKHIGFRSGLRMISAVIHENDLFDYDKGTNAFVRYREALKGAGPIIGTAAWCDLPKGGIELEFLNMETLEKIKAAATRIRKSPAWEGPFRDQMQRKSALKRLGKQVEMGEEFLKADAVEIAQDEHGDASRALDEFTDGAATKFLSQQTVEAATFGHLPRPAQVQVPAGATPVHALGVNGPVGSTAPAGKLDAATDRARAADAKRSRPTTAAASTPSQSSSASTSTPATGSAQPKATGPSSPTASPTTPAATSAGSASQPASAATPASSSPPASTTTQSTSTASASPLPPTTVESGTDVGDVAGEPQDGDTTFNTSFFGDESEDPVDQEAPARAELVTRADWVSAFTSWAEGHNSKAAAAADWDAFREIFEGWLACCTSKNDMDADKATFTGWSKNVFTVGRKEDKAKGIPAIPPDEQIVWMQDKFARQYKVLP